MVRVARHASPAEEAKYGTSILDAALSYIEAKTGGPTKGSLPVRFEALRIPVVRDGKTKHVLLENATLADITTATRALSAASGKKRSQTSPVEEQIATRLHAIASLAKVSVHVSGGMLRVGRIPIAALQHFVNALRGMDIGAVSDGAAKGNKAKAKKSGAARR